MKLKWSDTLDIAILLEEKFPNEDNVNLRYTDLHQWIVNLPEFSDDPNSSNEKILGQFKWLGLMKEINDKFFRFYKN